MAEGRLPGKIRPEYWISCGECGDEVCLATGRDPATHARSRGWRLTRASGWVCPTCAAEPRP